MCFRTITTIFHLQSTYVATGGVCTRFWGKLRLSTRPFLLRAMGTNFDDRGRWRIRRARFGQQRPSTSRTSIVFSGSIDDTAGRRVVRRRPLVFWTSRVAKYGRVSARTNGKKANVFYIPAASAGGPGAAMSPLFNSGFVSSVIAPGPGRSSAAVIAHDDNWYCYRVRGPSVRPYHAATTTFQHARGDGRCNRLRSARAAIVVAPVRQNNDDRSRREKYRTKNGGITRRRRRKKGIRRYQCGPRMITRDRWRRLVDATRRCTM